MLHSTLYEIASSQDTSKIIEQLFRSTALPLKPHPTSERETPHLLSNADTGHTGEEALVDGLDGKG